MWSFRNVNGDIPECPRLEVKYRIIRIRRHLPQQLRNPLHFGLKLMAIRERSIKIYLVQRPNPARVLHKTRAPRDGVYEPGLAPEVAGVHDCRRITLKDWLPVSTYSTASHGTRRVWSVLTEHHSTWTVVRVQERYADSEARSQLQRRGSSQRQWFLRPDSVSTLSFFPSNVRKLEGQTY